MAFKKISKVILIAIIIIVSFFVGTYSIDKSVIEKKGYDVGYSAGYTAAWDKATKLVESTTIPIFPMQGEMLSINGTIKDISLSGGSLTIEAGPVSTNPLSEDSKPTVRTIKITPATKIVKMTTKTPEQMQAMLSPDQPLIPTMPFSEEETTFSQLKQGDVITVTSDKNIKRETEIIALKITLQ
ncbi:hypothetical protein KKG29_03985 [Patescibacteria group bacterium]|nr:hypothetical protein [Patescibacteria group bacterium]MBU4368863.1 hypothetical protein [Patescibacteria group bacterium]